MEESNVKTEWRYNVVATHRVTGRIEIDIVSHFQLDRHRIAEIAHLTRANSLGHTVREYKRELEDDYTYPTEPIKFFDKTKYKGGEKN